MWTTLFRAGLLSIDSLVVATALSPLLRSLRQRCLLAGLFGFCDGLAVVIGASTQFRFAHLIVPMFVLVCGVYFLVAAFWEKFRADVRLAFFLPIVMSLDNFAYGVVSKPATSFAITDALILGFASFALAGLGIYVASRFEFSRTRSSRSFAGVALIAGSMLLLFS